MCKFCEKGKCLSTLDAVGVADMTAETPVARMEINNPYDICILVENKRYLTEEELAKENNKNIIFDTEENYYFFPNVRYCPVCGRRLRKGDSKLMTIGELKEMLNKFDDKQNVVFAKREEGYDCDVFKYVGNPILRNSVKAKMERLDLNEEIDFLPDNAVIFNINYK